MSEVDKAKAALWEEIYGTVEYLGKSYETVMSWPVNLRKYWIIKHNEKAERETQQEGSGNSISGISLNSYARMEQAAQSRK